MRRRPRPLWGLADTAWESGNPTLASELRAVGSQVGEGFQQVCEGLLNSRSFWVVLLIHSLIHLLLVHFFHNRYLLGARPCSGLWGCGGDTAGMVLVGGCPFYWGRWTLNS